MKNEAAGGLKWLRGGGALPPLELFLCDGGLVGGGREHPKTFPLPERIAPNVSRGLRLAVAVARKLLIPSVAWSPLAVTSTSPPQPHAFKP